MTIWFPYFLISLQIIHSISGRGIPLAMHFTVCPPVEPWWSSARFWINAGTARGGRKSGLAQSRTYTPSSTEFRTCPLWHSNLKHLGQPTLFRVWGLVLICVLCWEWIKINTKPKNWLFNLKGKEGTVLLYGSLVFNKWILLLQKFPLSIKKNQAVYSEMWESTNGPKWKCSKDWVLNKDKG